MKKVFSKRTYKIRKPWAYDELDRLFVAGSTDPMAKPSHFYCHLCRPVVFVLSYGSFDILRHYQGAKHFSMDQRLRLKTPGWRVPDFSGNPLPVDEIERQRVRIMRTPLVRRGREYFFARIYSLSGQSSVLAGSCATGWEHSWTKFSFTTSCVNIEVCWSRNEVLVSIRIFSASYTYLVPQSYVSVPENYVFVPHFHF